jgi:hypothetical protein
MQSRVSVWGPLRAANARRSIYSSPRQGTAKPRMSPLPEHLGQHWTALRRFPTTAQLSRKPEKVVPESQRRLHTEVTDVVPTKVRHLQKINNLGTKTSSLGRAKSNNSRSEKNRSKAAAKCDTGLYRVQGRARLVSSRSNQGFFLYRSRTVSFAAPRGYGNPRLGSRIGAGRVPY